MGLEPDRDDDDDDGCAPGIGLGERVDVSDGELCINNLLSHKLDLRVKAGRVGVAGTGVMWRRRMCALSNAAGSGVTCANKCELTGRNPSGVKEEESLLLPLPPTAVLLLPMVTGV